MVHAFVMVKTSAGTAEQRQSDIDAMDGVAESHVVAGNYDIIVEVETGEVYEILDTVSSGIRSLDGVTDTKTYISLE